MELVAVFLFTKNMKEIQLTKGKVALVDDEDFEYLNQWKWRAHVGLHTFYASRFEYTPRTETTKCKNKVILMHRVLLGIDSFHEKGDHIDRNGLNNQKRNLRVVTNAVNIQNRQPCGKSEFLGVCVEPKRTSKYRARIVFNGKRISLGSYKNEIDAAKAYNDAALKYYGENAYTNKF